MIEAAMIWNEPNNKSHWDPDASTPIGGCFRGDGDLPLRTRSPRENLAIVKVLGGMSPIDPLFVANMKRAWRSRPPRRYCGARIPTRLEFVAPR